MTRPLPSASTQDNSAAEEGPARLAIGEEEARRDLRLQRRHRRGQARAGPEPWPGPRLPWDSMRPRGWARAAAAHEDERRSAGGAHGQPRDFRMGAEKRRSADSVASRRALCSGSPARAPLARMRVTRGEPARNSRSDRVPVRIPSKARARVSVPSRNRRPRPSAAARREAAMLQRPAALTAATVRTAIVLNSRARRGSTPGIYRAGGASVRSGAGSQPTWDTAGTVPNR
jgi:hypothetical protein